MYYLLKKNWDRTKYLILSVFIITFVLLVAVVYKSDQKITKKSEVIYNSNNKEDLKIFKKFILSKIFSIVSPFTIL